MCFVRNGKNSGVDQYMKEYHFYGWKTADVKPVNREYPKIESPRDLYDALSDGIWSAQSCAPRYRDEWSPDNRTLGQCSITAFLAQDIFGGQVYGIPLPEGGVHCYNKVGDCVFDLASEQFGERAKDLVYANDLEQSRAIHFADADKKARYELLKHGLEKRARA